MRFDLNHGRFDPCSFIDRDQFFESDIGQANGPALVLLGEAFHRSPSLEQSYTVIINDVTILIAGIEVISRLERKGGVDQV